MSKETKTTEKPQDDFSAIPKNVLNLISKYATEKAIEMFNRQMEEQRAKAKDFRMKNTRLLVKKYRWLKSYAGNAVSELTQLLSEEELIFLESMGMDNLESRKVESIKDRMVFTQTVLGHIDTMLELYKNKCLNSERDEVRRRWRGVGSNVFDRQRSKSRRRSGCGTHKHTHGLQGFERSHSGPFWTVLRY